MVSAKATAEKGSLFRFGQFCAWQLFEVTQLGSGRVNQRMCIIHYAMYIFCFCFCADADEDEPLFLHPVNCCEPNVYHVVLFCANQLFYAVSIVVVIV